MKTPIQTRRVFLQRGLAILAVAPTVPSFLDRTMMAMADPFNSPAVQQPSGKDGKILIVVQLSGGNDGLNTIIPYGDDAYHRARPVLAHDAGSVLKINNYLGLHPNLKEVKALYDSGQMAIVQGVGYPNPNRSHFRSMDIWQSADPVGETPTSGWIGRYFDNACAGCDPKVGVSIGETSPLAMKGEHVNPLSFENPYSYRYNGYDKARYIELNKLASAPQVAPDLVTPALVAPANHSFIAKPAARKVEPVTAQSQLDFLARTAMDAQVSSDQILKITANHKGPQDYPTNEFGNGLRTIAAMIAGGLPTRVYYVSLGGFDTHANEKARHDKLMTDFSQGMGAFWADLKAQNNADRVLMMTFSEFGRRVETNASGGTDHGAAAPMMVFGQSIKPGIYGNHPSLTDLDQGDLKFNTDFRNVYATVLQEWMDTPSKPILGQQFKTMDMVKA
jgi:uncharacterized protein (DUF1501 family)